MLSFIFSISISSLPDQIQSPAPKKSAKKSRGTGEKERMFPGKLESKVSLKDLKGSGVKEKGKEGEKEKSSGAKGRRSCMLDVCMLDYPSLGLPPPPCFLCKINIWWWLWK